jgi:hypothetical protein
MGTKGFYVEGSYDDAGPFATRELAESYRDGWANGDNPIFEGATKPNHFITSFNVSTGDATWEPNE